MRPTYLLAFIILTLITGYIYIALPTCNIHPETCFGDPNAPPAPPTAPGVYRVLQPALERFLAPDAAPNSVGVIPADIMIQIVCIVFTVPCLYIWLRRWLTVERALLGAMLFALAYMMSYHFTYRVLSTSLEVTFLAVALALLGGNWVWLTPLVVLGSLNRETALLIPLIYAAYHGRSKWRESVALLAIWAVITGGLHLAIGYYPHMLGSLVGGTLAYNLQPGNLVDAILTNLLFIPLVILAVSGYRLSPALLRRFTWIAAAYLAAMVAGAAWNETNRLILPILPFILPVISKVL